MKDNDIQSRATQEWIITISSIFGFIFQAPSVTTIFSFVDISFVVLVTVFVFVKIIIAKTITTTCV
jgi:hypothetical protein